MMLETDKRHTEIRNDPPAELGRGGGLPSRGSDYGD